MLTSFNHYQKFLKICKRAYVPLHQGIINMNGVLRIQIRAFFVVNNSHVFAPIQNASWLRGETYGERRLIL